MAVVRSVLGSAPQVEFASLPRRLFLVATLAFTFCTCLAKDRVLSRVTPRRDLIIATYLIGILFFFSLFHFEWLLDL